jgi:hypothetical protein
VGGQRGMGYTTYSDTVGLDIAYCTDKMKKRKNTDTKI